MPFLRFIHRAEQGLSQWFDMAKEKQQSELTIDDKAKRGTVILRAGFFGAAAHPTLEQVRSYTSDGKASMSAVAPPQESALMPEEVKPKPEDFVTRKWRLLSQTLVERGHYLDFSTPGVLEAAVPLAKGITVFQNHWTYSAEDWVGLVADSEWDAAGANADGVPGINGTVLIDAVQAPKVARGVLVNAINSGSVGIIFEFQFSHPQIVAEHGIWEYRRRCGQTIDEQVVRFVVTKIIEFVEFSICPRGADRYAKVQPDSEDEDGLTATGLTAVPPPVTKEKTVKLSATQIKSLGLQGQDGQDFADADVLGAVDTKLAALTTKATGYDQLIEAQRVEAKRQALLAAGVPEGGQLAVADELAISNATPEQLAQLTQAYTAKAALAFPQTCQKCGAKALSGQSSVDGEALADASDTPNVNVV